MWNTTERFISPALRSTPTLLTRDSAARSTPANAHGESALTEFLTELGLRQAIIEDALGDLRRAKRAAILNVALSDQQLGHHRREHALRDGDVRIFQVNVAYHQRLLIGDPAAASCRTPRGQPVVTAALMDPLSKAFVAAIHRFVVGLLRMRHGSSRPRPSSLDGTGNA